MESGERFTFDANLLITSIFAVIAGSIFGGSVRCTLRIFRGIAGFLNTPSSESFDAVDFVEKPNESNALLVDGSSSIFRFCAVIGNGETIPTREPEKEVEQN